CSSPSRAARCASSAAPSRSPSLPRPSQDPQDAMSDTKISALPAATTPAEADLLPIVQGAGGGGAETRRTSLAGLRAGLLADRPAHVRDFGAVGNGVTDDGPAIQAAINALNAGG